jgi:hypothetical protein
MNSPIKQTGTLIQPGLVLALVLFVSVFLGGCDQNLTLPAEGDARADPIQQAGVASALPYGPDSVTIDDMRAASCVAVRTERDPIVTARQTRMVDDQPHMPESI